MKTEKTAYCKLCGEKFRQVRTEQFCSENCRHEWKLQKSREYKREHYRHAEPREIICKCCGKPFRGMSNAKYCIPCLQNGNRDMRAYLKNRTLNTEEGMRNG